MDMSSAGLILASWVWLLQILYDSHFVTDCDKLLLKKKILKRMEKYISPHHFLCWVLDPRCKGCGLSGNGKRQVRDIGLDFFSHLYPEDTADELIKQWLLYDHKNGEI